MSNNHKPKAKSPSTKINIDVNSLPMLTCPKCHNPAFVEAVEIRVLSLLLSPTGKTEILKVPIAVCSMCGRKVLNGDIENVSVLASRGSNDKSDRKRQ